MAVATRVSTTRKTAEASPADLLKTLPAELLAAGADLAIVESFMLMKQFDPNAKFNQFFKEAFDGKAMSLEIPSVVIALQIPADEPLTLEDQLELYLGYLEAGKTEENLLFEEYLISLADSEAAQAGDPEPAAAAPAGKKGGKKAAVEKKPKTARAKTTPEQDAEFQNPPADAEEATHVLEVSKKDAALVKQFVDAGGSDDVPSGTALKTFSIDIDKEFRVLLLVTNPEPPADETAPMNPVYFDAVVVDQAKDSVADAESGVSENLFGRYKFSFDGRRVILDVVPASK